MELANLFRPVQSESHKIRELIENSLLFDWIIRVEVACGNAETEECWQQWDRTFFALRSAEAVLATLADCHTKHPDRTIRLNAEKVHPHTRMMYTVYNPRLLPTPLDIKPQIVSLRFC